MIFMGAPASFFIKSDIKLDSITLLCYYPIYHITVLFVDVCISVTMQGKPGKRYGK